MAALLAWPVALAAQSDEFDNAADLESVPSWYFGLLGGYVVPDSVRDANYGINAHLILGAALGDSVDLEFNAFHQQTQRDSDERNDYSYGGGLDLTLGTPAPGNPFFMIGGGVIHEDLRTARRSLTAAAGYEDNSGYANAGLGIYLPFSFFGELWRLEGRYNIVFNDQALHPDQIAAGQTAPDDFLEDVRFNLGIVFAFSREQLLPPVEPPPPPPPLEPPPPPPSDTDVDGVTDELDRCPGTPRWVRADAAGCTPDSDRDGVDETRDCCPNTPAGAPVDGQGCEPPPPPPPPLVPSAPLPDTDADNDGVVDRLDECPHTIPGYMVNANGCVKIQDVVVKSVHFELDSDALTPEAYRLLLSVASSFKAQPEVVAEVAGHADSSGGPGYNMALSQRRASVVRDFLIFAGVPSDRLVSAGYGETRPIGDNSTEEGRALNRRVEFRMLDR
jgi:OOP family OmpA-OmpF porin